MCRRNSRVERGAGMAPQQQRLRSRRLACVAAGALASGPGYAVGAGVVGVDDPPAPTPASVTPATTPVTPAPLTPPASPTTPVTPTDTPEPKPADKGPAFGAYLDYGARGVARIAELSKW